MKIIKPLFLLTIALVLTACSGKQSLRLAEQQYSDNLNRANVAILECKKLDNIVVEYVDSGQNEAKITVPSRGCKDEVPTPIHGGEFVANIVASQNNLIGQLGGASITAVASVINTNSSNDTRVEVAELDRDVQISDNGVVLEAISVQADSTNAAVAAVADSNAILSDFIQDLIEPEDAEPEVPADES